MTDIDTVEAVIEDLCDVLRDKGFIGSDASLTISLGEYGFVWNPETDRYISTYPCYLWGDMDEKPKFDTGYISQSGVRDRLEQIEEGFFDFIGSDKETELDRLSEGMVPYYVQSINQYNGSFRIGERFPHDKEQVIELID